MLLPACSNRSYPGDTRCDRRVGRPCHPPAFHRPGVLADPELKSKRAASGTRCDGPEGVVPNDTDERRRWRGHDSGPVAVKLPTFVSCIAHTNDAAR